MTSLVVTPCECLDPSPGVSSCLHNFGCAFAQADEPEDLVVATQDRIVGFAITALQLLWSQVRFELYSLWHNALLYTRTWYYSGSCKRTSMRRHCLSRPTWRPL